MAWLRVDDRFDDHPKILQAWSETPVSIGVWPRAGAWAARHRTDGHVTTDYLRDLLPNRRARDRVIGALVDAGLWLPNGTGWEFHDWRDFNGTSDDRKAAWAKRPTQ